MTTYYTIHAYDQESGFYKDGDLIEDLIDNCMLYKTFESARKAIEEEILEYIKKYNAERDPKKSTEEIFVRPNITGLKSYEKYCHYYETYDGYLFTIGRMEVAEE